MNISAFIQKLSEIQKRRGDVSVFIHDDFEDLCYDVLSVTDGKIVPHPDDESDGEYSLADVIDEDGQKRREEYGVIINYL